MTAFGEKPRKRKRRPAFFPSVFVRPAAVLCAVAAALFFAGFAFASSVILDPEANRIYRCVTAAEMLRDLSENQARAENRYSGQYLVIRGRLEGEADKNAGTARLIPSGGQTDSTAIRCHLPAGTLREKAFDLQKSGGEVLVYGLAQISRLPITQYTLNVQGIAEAEEDAAVTGEETYRFLSGASFRRSDLAERAIGQNRLEGGAAVSYRIPGAWSGVEEALQGVDGYLYRLNELPGAAKAEPEQLYVFYFDNEKYLLNREDLSRTSEIERAIIRNILPDERIGFGKFPRRKDVYGTPFQYYDTGYSGYHAEFAFAADGDDGIFCILYICETAEHINDILILLRMLSL